MSGAFERHARLAQDFAGDEGVVTLDDAAGIDQLEFPAAVLGLSVDAVAGNAGLIAHNGAARAQDRVEKGRLTDVGSSNDDDGGLGERHATSMIALLAV